jgi:alpha-glucosidase (family GH31 glycosyl hydrolase)
MDLIAGMRERGTRLGLILTPFLNTHNNPIQKRLLNTFGQNVTPGLEDDDERALDEFNETRANGYLAHEHVRWWFGTGGMLDFTHPGAVAWWRKKLLPLFEAGADFIKNDDGEDLPDDARSFNGMDGREYHNLYGFYYGRATYEREPSSPQLPANEQLRSLIYARTAWIGSQRYPALFLGDQEANFEGIRHSLRAGLNLAMGGFSYWTADVFGLAGKTSPEVHMRYAQWSLLSPVARYFVRPEKIDDTRFPWSHSPQVEANFRKYSELRMRLLPYFNSLAHESYMAGTPVMRPLQFEFEQDVRLRSVDDQIMLGGNLMVCPVTQVGALSRRIVLPQGEWHDFWSERVWQGGGTIDYAAPSDCLPLLVRGGTILPLGPVIQNIPDTHVFDMLDLHMWGPFPAEGMFFDDDGRTCAYQHGAFSRTRLRAEQVGDRLWVRISATQGVFSGQVEKRKVRIILHQPVAAQSALFNHELLEMTQEDGLVCISFEHLVNHDSLIEIMLNQP